MQTVKQSITDFNLLTEYAPVGIFKAGSDGECKYTNLALQKMLGLSFQETLGTGYTTYFHPDDKKSVIKHWYHCVINRKDFSYSLRVLLPNNNQKQILINATPIFNEAKQELIYTGSVEDVSELNNALYELKLNQQRYELVVKGASAGIWDWDIKANSVYYSDKFTDLLGYDNFAFGKAWDSFLDQIHPSDLNKFEQAINEHLASSEMSLDIECRFYTQKRNLVWFQIVGQAIINEENHPQRMVGSVLDITEKKQSQQVIWHQANFDHLTQLPNRNMFIDRLKQEIIKCKRNKEKFALLFIDLDHFKEVNDTLGHNAGDNLLIEASERLQLILRESDTVARIGGDEFTAIISQIQELSDIDNVAQKIIQAIELPFNLDNESVFISASIGITLFPEHSEEMTELLRFADQAMYKSKAEGRKRFSYFSEQLQLQANKNRHLSQELRVAIIDQHFEVLYQPIMSLSDNQVIKAEALIRWHHPELGMISPADFIPLAESTGIIDEIGNWVFLCAAKQVKQWQQLTQEKFQISVNKSPVQFLDTDNATNEFWFDVLKELDLDHGICIEITEGLLLDDAPEIKEKLINFQKMGIDISLDDFGTGYASLSYLTKFNINFLKIDQAFVFDLENSPQNQALCEAIIVMAHKLGLKVIAEGVETQAEMDILRSAGCDYIQGYLISKPISHVEFTRQLNMAIPFDIQINKQA